MTRTNSPKVGVSSGDWRYMNQRQQIVQERTQELAAKLGVGDSEAFMRFVYAVIAQEDAERVDPADTVDGGGDKQIDVLAIQEDEDEATIFVIQAKFADGFPMGDLVKMGNGLDWLFSRNLADVEGLANKAFADRIKDFRSARKRLGPSNLRIVAGFVTNGDCSTQVGDEFGEELKAINERYNNDTYDHFELRPWGADELVAALNEIEKRKRQIDAVIPIRYDTNNPSLIKYHAAGMKGLVCTASAADIADLVAGDTTGTVFDLNVRRFLGEKKAVNADILRTCTSADEAALFWFLNNGVTVICDSFDAVTDPDDPHVQLKNMQIINGCQTASALALARSRGDLQGSSRILLRIYQTEDLEVVNRIVLSTNNQNQVSTRDLRANDAVQRDMEQMFAAKGYHYERKVRQYAGVPNVDPAKIVTNEGVAQAYLALVMKRPSDARRRKYKIWGELYTQVFSGAAVETYLVPILFANRMTEWLDASGYRKSADDVLRKTANNGGYHVARIACQLWRADNAWGDVAVLSGQMAALEGGEYVDDFMEIALELLVAAIRADATYLSDIDGALKSGKLDADIDRLAYSSVS